MEQRIGSSSQPLEGAGFDPAFIPGLTSPASGREEDAKAKPEEPEDTVPEDTTPEPEPEVEEESAAEEPAVPDGPVFEASDRRARVVADHSGVRLRLDDQECEFRWDEIGAVETETARFGKRWTLTVHTPDRRWYPIEVEAPSRSSFAEWDTALDAVLDTYFEDGEEQSEKDDRTDDRADDRADDGKDDRADDRADDGKDDRADDRADDGKKDRTDDTKDDEKAGDGDGTDAD
ncbi:hypothetical protein ACIA6T_25910 [Streptomyces sp. NPDC051740]|uniref:hypothetical protein n=1 Tax=Streptomyces sp. NPDC051740 TaxID=3365673 RepID=UPI0037B8A0A5